MQADIAIDETVKETDSGILKGFFRGLVSREPPMAASRTEAVDQAEKNPS
ncbi:MAG: hypothetical protein HY657_17565 [Acidobacteria bacterium]|nr:hypothetical protein [Acidobacteriota bacterium]